MKFEWEKINYMDSYLTRTWRAKVFGGWTLRVETWDAGQSESMVFIPDALHQWEINKE